jgi:hypothetical protein
MYVWNNKLFVRTSSTIYFVHAAKEFPLNQNKSLIIMYARDQNKLQQTTNKDRRESKTRHEYNIRIYAASVMT